MDKSKIQKIEKVFGFECIEYHEDKEKHFASFQHPISKSVILFEEMVNRVPNEEPKYYVNCNPELDCWDGWDDFREVVKCIKKYYKAVETIR